MSRQNKALIVDLDDTLYSEIDYLKSAFFEISKKLSDTHEPLLNKMLELYYCKEDVFQYLVNAYGVDKSLLVNWYRDHKPNIYLHEHVLSTFDMVSKFYRLGLVTDGRSITQRNKISSLGILNYFDCIIISEEIGSEKPDKRNYLMVSDLLKCDSYTYVGDNIKKDFITPNKLGWNSICLLDKGYNIHSQSFNLNEEYLPKKKFSSWLEIKNFLMSE